MNEQELEALKAEIDREKEHIKRQREALMEKKVRYARAICPYKPGERVLNTETGKVFEVVQVAWYDFSPNYEIHSLLVKKDGTTSLRRQTLHWYDIKHLEASHG